MEESWREGKVERGQTSGENGKEVVLRGQTQGSLAAWVLSLPLAAGSGCHRPRFPSSPSRTPWGSIIFQQHFSFLSIFTPDPYLRAGTTMD